MLQSPTSRLQWRRSPLEPSIYDTHTQTNSRVLGKSAVRPSHRQKSTQRKTTNLLLSVFVDVVVILWPDDITPTGGTAWTTQQLQIGNTNTPVEPD